MKTPAGPRRMTAPGLVITTGLPDRMRLIRIFLRNVLVSMHVEAPPPLRSEQHVRVMSTRGVETLEHDRLIEAVALRRDREAFSQLFSYFAPRLKAWLMKAGADAAAAEDFAQDAMLTVWRKADLFDSRKARAATWIFTIARNRRLDMLRRDARSLPLPEIAPVGEDDLRPDHWLLAEDEARRVHEALSHLNPEQVEVLRLAFFAEDPHSEISRRLGLPLGTVKSRIRNAMIKLRHLLEPAEEAAR